MSLQIASDLHLECRPATVPRWASKLLRPSAPYLLLLGDICPIAKEGLYRLFFSQVSKFYRQVLVVNGNHEFYDPKFERSIAELKEVQSRLLSPFPNVSVVDDRVVEFKEGFRVVGSTLWSHVTPAAERKLNDYRCIFSSQHHPLTFADVNKMHAGHVDFVGAALADDYAGVTLVATHHAPLLGSSDPKYATEDGFASDLSRLVPRADYWVYGHTHWPCNKTFQGCQVISNPMGYHHESRLGFDRACTISFEEEYRGRN